MKFLPTSVAFAFALIFSVSAAKAGDAPLSVFFVNMTPDALSLGDSKVCVNTIHSVFKKDYTEIKKLGETKLRKYAAVPKGGAHFLTWSAAHFTKLSGKYHEAVVLVDCRPKEQVLDILISTPADVQTITLHGVPPTKSLVESIAKRALAQAWTGFSP